MPRRKLIIDKIYLGDCLELMKEIPDKSIDCIICDLPYGTTKCKWDIIIPFDKLWEHYNRIIKDNGAIALFGKEPFSSRLRLSNIDMYKYDWIWVKNTKSNFMQANNQPLNNVELISVFSKGYARKIKDKVMMKYNPQFMKGDVYKIPKTVKTSGLFSENHKNGTYRHYERDTSKRFPYNIIHFNVDKTRVHPTQKPVELLEYLLKTYSDEGDLILDNCMGSGTTAIAAIKEKRHFIGMELNKEYYDVACKRIEYENKTRGRKQS